MKSILPLHDEAAKLSRILLGMTEGGYQNLHTLYTEEQPDGDAFVRRASEVLALFADPGAAKTQAAEETLEALVALSNRIQDCARLGLSAREAYDSFYEEWIPEVVAKASGIPLGRAPTKVYSQAEMDAAIERKK